MSQSLIITVESKKINKNSVAFFEKYSGVTQASLDFIKQILDYNKQSEIKTVQDFVKCLETFGSRVLTEDSIKQAEKDKIEYLDDESSSYLIMLTEKEIKESIEYSDVYIHIDLKNQKVIVNNIFFKPDKEEKEDILDSLSDRAMEEMKTISEKKINDLYQNYDEIIEFVDGIYNPNKGLGFFERIFHPNVSYEESQGAFKIEETDEIYLILD